MKIEQKKVPILELAQGALAEEVAFQLGKVAENILDPNTEWKKARKLTINMEFTTSEDRQIVSVTATTQAKLVPSKPVKSQITFGADSNGEICAVELTKVTPGQVDIYGGEAPAANIFSINTAKQAK